MDSRDLNLMVGAGLQLEKQAGNERYLVELLGYSVGQGVIISAPQESDERMALASGDEVTLRYLGGGSQQSFKSQVSLVATEPYPHVHLSYPSGSEAVISRRAVRMPVKQTPVRLAMRGADQRLAMEDISHGGARLVASERLAKQGESFSIDIPTLAPDREAVVTLTCAVRYIREASEDGESVFHHGIEFENVDAAARTFISRFIRANI